MDKAELGSDFGHSKIEWREVDPSILEVGELEYKQRLIASAGDWGDLDQKARYLFSGLIGLNTVIIGWTFSHAESIEFPYRVGLLVLAGMFSLAIMAAALSLWPREYGADKGVTPANLDVSAWSDLLTGDKEDLKELSGVRIKEYAKSICQNDSSNSRKSAWLTLSVGVLFSAFPIAMIAVAAVPYLA